MTARIVIVDDAAVTTIGTVDRDSTFLGLEFDLSNYSNTGVLAWEWTLVDRPIGSSAVLTTPTPQTAKVTPDVAGGTYLVRLVTYSDVGATVVDGADEQCIGIRFPSPFDHRIPAAGETTQFSSRGWATAREEAIRDVHAFMQSGVPTLIGAMNTSIVGSDPETVIGGFVVEGQDLPPLAVKLRLIGVLTSATGAADLRLYDLGPAAGPAVAGVLRATATILLADAGSPIVVDTDLTPDAAPGVDADEIHNSRRLYELRAELVGGAATDVFKIHSGAIVLEG